MHTPPNETKFDPQLVGVTVIGGVAALVIAIKAAQMMWTLFGDSFLRGLAWTGIVVLALGVWSGLKIGWK